jgi:hypothetical protein
MIVPSPMNDRSETCLSRWINPRLTHARIRRINSPPLAMQILFPQPRPTHPHQPAQYCLDAKPSAATATARLLSSNPVAKSP